MTTSSSNIPPSPWHPGEVSMQRTVGVAEKMDVFGRRVIRNYMPEQHREFYARLPFVVVGAVDTKGNAWATLITGKPGFVSSSNSRALQFDSRRDPCDPADAGMDNDNAIGLLGIELNTRRRNRMNGTLLRSDDAGFSVAVEHAFGNCPQYIQLRNYRFEHDPASLGEHINSPRLDYLNDHARAIIKRADTFFVASYINPEGGLRQVDVSHRGGKAGFIRIDADGTLTIPDFAGNLHFNTLGNFQINPKAGLAFVDFENGDLLQMSGDAEVILDAPEIMAFQGAERLWRFQPRIIALRQGAIPLRWALADWSPNTMMTGSWEEATKRLSATGLKAGWRPFRVKHVVQESTVVRSYHLEPADGAGLIVHEAGQHLAIRLNIPGTAIPLIRTYTISTASSDNTYRISVKRQGISSIHLHDVIRAGDIIEARAPTGSFTINAAERRPAVLLAAGIGITPLLAMLRHIVYEGLRTRRFRPTWLFYAARSKDERAFDRELAELVRQSNGAVKLIRFLGDLSDKNFIGVDFEVPGRIDMAGLRQTLAFDDYDFYLCGPPPFMQSIYDGLRDLNIADTRIHAEVFGPASLKRRVDVGYVEPESAPRVWPSAEPVTVAFMSSEKEARWTPSSGSLLDLAEARGLNPDFNCRSGSCGTCRTRILQGTVAYPIQPSAKIAAGEALICCAVPADNTSSGGERLVLDL